MNRDYYQNTCILHTIPRLPANVYAVSTESALSILDISQSTLTDLKECLNYEKPDGWNYVKGQQGLTRRQFQVLAILLHLVRTLGRRAAQIHLHDAINQYLEQKEEDHG